MSIRESQEEIERQYLSRYACLSSESKGRMKPLEPCSVRMAFQRDRDRILHCKSFRRLKHKTQVFLLPDGDHYRTRLTHTLEVSQIARTIARALRLNEDLVEAISLGHDLGHTPFGHKGEAVLNQILPEGFEHNEQSLRVVDVLENDGTGLNLTYEVRDGIINHKRNSQPATLEGKIICYADRIAYLNHDIDDSIRAGILSPEQLPKDTIRILGATHGQRIENMIMDIVQKSNNQEFIRMSDEFEYAMERLRDFMFERVYMDSTAKKEEQKIEHVITELYSYYFDNAGMMPKEYVLRIYCDGLEQAVADFIAGMTDRYAISAYEHIFVPHGWMN